MQPGEEINNIDIIFQEVKDAISYQASQKESLETKASMLIAFAGIIFALLMGAVETLSAFTGLMLILLILSIILFGISAMMAFIVNWVKKYRTDPDPEALIDTYLNKTKEETQLQLISNWKGRIKHNDKIIEDNADLLRTAFLFQTTGFLLLGSSLLISVIDK